jgi:membrane fusion protein (multidrug efflux system)
MATGSIAAAPRPQSEPTISPRKTAWRRFVTPLLIVLMALAIALTIMRNWNAWEGGRIEQVTNDAYVKRDLTPLSTKVVGLVREVKVNDYQQVRKGDELVLLADDDYRAQASQASAAVEAAKAALENNRRQRDLQDARIERALAGIDQAQRRSSLRRPARRRCRPMSSRTNAERIRQEALVATGSATRQRVEAAVADAERFSAQLASREADLTQARTVLRSNELAVEAERPEQGVLESQGVAARRRSSTRKEAAPRRRARSISVHAHRRAGRRHRRRAASPPGTTGVARHPGHLPSSPGRSGYRPTSAKRS